MMKNQNLKKLPFILLALCLTLILLPGNVLEAKAETPSPGTEPNMTQTGIEATGITGGVLEIAVTGNMNSTALMTTAINDALVSANASDVTTLKFTGGAGCMLGVSPYSPYAGFLDTLLPNLKTLDLSDYLGNFNSNAFYKCKVITTVKLPVGAAITGSMFEGCTNLTTVGATSNVVDLTSCVSFGRNAFQSCTSITEVKLPPSVSVSGFMFYGCTRLTTVGATPNVVDLTACTSFGTYAFYGCTSITAVKLPTSTAVSECIFYGCTSLTTVGATSNVVDLTSCASFDSSAFRGCTSITEVKLPAGAAISDNMFYGCTNLTTVGTTSNVVDLTSCTSFGYSGFDSCTSITSVKLPVGAAISNYMFYGCTSLTTVGATSNVVDLTSCTSFGYSGFQRCTSITEVKLPTGAAVSNNMFERCTSLTTVGAMSNVVDLTSCTSFGVEAFDSCTSIIEVKLPAGAAISDNMFYGCTNLTTVGTTPNVVDLTSCTSFDSYAFSGCTSITAVKLPTGKAVFNNMFSGCTSLTTVGTTSNVVDLTGCTSFGSYTFYGCTSITAVKLPTNVNVSSRMFSGCTSLTTVGTTPKVIDLTGYAGSFGSYAFSGCTSITAVKLPTNVNVSSHMFSGCTSLTTVGTTPKVIDLTDYAGSFGSYAFSGCTSITAVKLPSSAAVSSFMFYDCSRLKTIALPDTTPTISTDAFTNATSPMLLVNDSAKANYATLPDNLPANAGFPTIKGGGLVVKDTALTLSITPDASLATAVTYQWKKDGNSIAGATSRIYTKNNATTGDNGSYTCEVTLLGTTYTTVAATVTVTPACIVEATAASNTPNAGAGNEITLTVKDSDGATDTTFSGLKTVSLSGVAPALSGSDHGSFGGTTINDVSNVTAAVVFENGVGMVDLSLFKAVAQSLTFNVADVVTPATDPITITPSCDTTAATAVLAVMTQPTAPAANGGVLAQQPVLTVKDKYGNPFADGVEITASAKDSQWTIGGQTSVNTADGTGTVTYTDLTAAHTSAVTGAAIIFTLGGSKTIGSSGFNIPAPPLPTATVSFHANGGSGSMTAVSVPKGSYTLPSCTFARSNYSFGGWRINNTGATYAAGASITVDSNITLYAQWISGGPAFTAVTNIKDVPGTATAGTALTLKGTVEPSNATNKTIQWTVKEKGTTGAQIVSGKLVTTGSGTAVVTATVKNGKTSATNYTKDFAIKVSHPVKKGSTYTVSGYKYKVTSITNSKKEVSFVGLTAEKKKSVTTLDIKNTVKIKGITMKITAVGKNALKGNKKVKTVKIGNNVQTIGNSAFTQCTALKSVTIGTGLKTIEEHAFCYDAKLRTITIKSNKLKNVKGKHVFYKVKATIKVPSSKVSAYKKLFKGKSGSLKVTK